MNTTISTPALYRKLKRACLLLAGLNLLLLVAVFVVLQHLPKEIYWDLPPGVSLSNLPIQPIHLEVPRDFIEKLKEEGLIQ